MTLVPSDFDESIVQRVLFPLDGDESARNLYVRADHDPLRWTRTSLDIAPGASVSFATYFAAFPSGQWRAATDLEEIELAVRVEGRVTVRVCAADERIARRVYEERSVEGLFTARVPLSVGTWLWFEVDDGGAGSILVEAAWRAQPKPMPALSVCITTHDRPDECVEVLRRLSADAVVLADVVSIFVVDQGFRKVADAQGFEEAAAALGGRLTVINQTNLGGSGGFSRGMIEAARGEADNVLILDDDVLLEPESIRRLAAFAAHACSPTIVGAQMLSLEDRTLLHSAGERIEPRGFWWTPVEPSLAPVDLATATIEETPELRRVHDVAFNGWWMCMIPLVVVRSMGASLPFFIKWDDAEFSLRAAAVGVPTVTLPGAAIWHMPWTGKDDGLDWQSYYQLRNRVVTALIHSRGRRGRGVLSSTFALDVNHIVCLQYGSAAARRVALEDILRGPSHLPETIAHRTADIRALMVRAGQLVVPDDRLPRPRMSSGATAPQGRGRVAGRLLRVLWNQATPSRATGVDYVDVALDRAHGKWWSIGLVDSVTVTSATGRGAFVGRRSRRVALALLRDALALRLRLWVAWPALARAYARAAPELASAKSWESLFSSSMADLPPTPPT